MHAPSGKHSNVTQHAFLCVTQALMDSEPNWGAVARDATEMIWQKTINALAHHEKPLVGAHMGFGGAYGGDVEGVCISSLATLAVAHFVPEGQYVSTLTQWSLTPQATTWRGNAKISPESHQKEVKGNVQTATGEAALVRLEYLFMRLPNLSQSSRRGSAKAPACWTRAAEKCVGRVC